MTSKETGFPIVKKCVELTKPVLLVMLLMLEH